MSKSGIYRLNLVLMILAVAVAPMIVAGSVWYPVFSHFQVAGAKILDATIAQSRQHPADAVADEVSRFQLGAPGAAGADDWIEAVAEALSRGEVALSRFPRKNLRMPFDPDQVSAGLSNWQLAYCGFLVPNVFLAAFEVTARPEFLAAARDFIIGWNRFEKSLWLPRGFVWNDHAIAARAVVLADFWHRYMDSPCSRPSTRGRSWIW